MKFMHTNSIASRINSRSVSRPCHYGTGRDGTERNRLNLAASTHPSASTNSAGPETYQNRPFKGSGHMVRNKLHRDSKQRKVGLYW